MARLTMESYWDGIWTGVVRSHQGYVAPSRRPGLRATLRERLRELTRDYADYLEWDVLYGAHLPRGRGLRAIEVGSAPGVTLVRLHREYGYEPFGVEYAESGVELNRENFRAAGIDPANVLRADALSEEFLREHEGRYDVVVSRGFIEHFTELDRVIGAHVRLLRPGGRLIVTIPKLTGVPNLLFRAFNPDVIPMHNLSIMNRRTFASLFRRPELEQIHCGDLGVFRVHVCGTLHLRGLRAAAMRGLMNVQLGLNAAFRLAFGRQPPESHLFSPYLVYVGTRTS